MADVYFYYIENKPDGFIIGITDSSGNALPQGTSVQIFGTLTDTEEEFNYTDEMPLREKKVMPFLKACLYDALLALTGKANEGLLREYYNEIARSAGEGMIAKYGSQKVKPYNLRSR